MRKNIIFILFIFISAVLTAEAIYNGNISVVENDFFSGYVIDEPGVYAGGSNTFPIGSYVEVKLPHSENKASVKIVRRIPETGRFILVDENAGNQLGLTKDDVVLVSVVVTKFIPNPSEELESFTPEPEIKGFTSDVINTTTTEAVETTSSNFDDAAKLSGIPEDSSVVTGEELSNTIDPEDPSKLTELPKEIDKEDSEEVIIENIYSDDDTSKELALLDESKKSDDTVSNFPVKDEMVDNTLFDDVEDSMFSEVPELEEESEEYDDKIVKRVYFLEPANKKPPVGGIPDKDLVPVTKNDKSKEFKEGYYLQVGIYSDKDHVLRAQEKLDTYNLPYLSVKKEMGDKKNILLVGPLTNDEQGVIMLYLKDKGFHDFFKYKKKE